MEENEFIRNLCKINYEGATNLVNNNKISIKEYKEMLKTLILALNGVRK